MDKNELEISELAIDQINAIFSFHEKVRLGKGADFLENSKVFNSLHALLNYFFKR